MIETRLIARATALMIAASTTAAMLLLWLLPDVRGGLANLASLASFGGADDSLREPARLDVLITQVSAVVGSACILWLWLCLATTLSDVLRGASLRPRRGCPRFVLALVSAVCGAAVAVAPAHADDRTPSAPSGSSAPSGPSGQSLQSGQSDLRAPEPSAEILRGLRTPALPDTGPARRPAPRPALGPARPRPATSPTRPAAPGVVLVRPGDSLWRIAEARLPPHATAARIDDLVGRIHAANRAVIGADPDLIHPAQRLRVDVDRQE